MLLFDGSTATSHATQCAWIVQQLGNKSLSGFYNGGTTVYNQAYEKAVLAENLIQPTGRYTFNVNVQNPNAAFSYLIGNYAADIIAPNFVMQHDLALWTQPSNGYTLPYPTLSGNLSTRIGQYFQDLVATCNSGATKAGCGATYLSTSEQGSLAGTGPYTLQSHDLTTNTITLQANPNYWGGPYQYRGGAKISAKIKTAVFKYVPDQTTREIDLQNAAKSGQAMAIDLEATNLYDIADRAQWIQNNKLVSDVPGVSLYGPWPFIGVNFEIFDTNVTSPLTGQYYKFQPFADRRIRLAFADAVNMTAEWLSADNKIGNVATSGVPPGYAPAGVYNTSIKPAYSYNPDQAASLLLDAMMHPITTFHFTNGTLDTKGTFNNAFGCAKLPCSNPITQTIPLLYGTGDTTNEAILNDIAGTINNISTTYNMGLTVAVQPLPSAELGVWSFSVPNHVYMGASGFSVDYPWVLDFTGCAYAYPGVWPGPDGWNIGQLNTLFQQSVKDSASNNTAALISDTYKMQVLANQMVMYLWTFDNINWVTMTSNVQGLYWNPAYGLGLVGGDGPQYFASLY